VSARPWEPARALSGASYSAVELAADGDRAWVLEQRALPHEERYVDVRSAAEMTVAIRDMVVRGAPAIGIAAAYGLALEARRLESLSTGDFSTRFAEAARLLAQARPTAVNLAWAVSVVLAKASEITRLPGPERTRALAALARRLHQDDVAACRAMGARGADLLPRRDGPLRVLTHCNAGALATGGYGTALGVIRAAREAGRDVRVFADETRPYLQGARLTAWELARDGIDVTVVCDGMAGWLMAKGEIDAVVVGADRIARNGDVANKIGTYSVACLAHAHGIPFFVAAPESTLDPATRSGADIVIEERSRDEVAFVAGTAILPDGVPARHPAFDVTPNRLVTAIVTERAAYGAGEEVVPMGAPA
jgi:methylthioribose-1-phosphate isomerase